MKSNHIVTNPIGLAQDFTDLFDTVLRSETSSDNWFQQYQTMREVCRIRLEHIDSMLSSSQEVYRSRLSTYSTEKNVVPLSNEDFADKYKTIFYKAVIKSPINIGEDTESTIMFSDLLSQNKITTLHILNELFINNIEDEHTCVKLLSLCNDYRYDELYPTAQTLAALSINHQSKRVKSAAMNLFSHWGTREAYNLLCSIECPEDPWIVMKYQTIKKSLEKKWCM